MKYKRLILILGAVLLIVVAFLLFRDTATKPVSTSAISTDVPVSVVAVEKQKLASSISLAGSALL